MPTTTKSEPRPAARSAALSRALGSIAAMALILTACGGTPATVEVGARSPSFELENVAGGTLSSGDLAGRPAVINFWATWCQPCMKDLPELNELVAGGGLSVVAIALDETGRRAVEPFLASHDLRATVLLGDQEAFQRFQGFAIPYTLVLDADQTIRAIYRGAFTAAQVRDVLERAG
jgi:thiol-disulfide isomerase/thioredoxin